VLDLPLDDVPRPGPRRGVAAAHHFHGVQHRRQRVAQLVGQHGQELVFALVGLADLAVEPGVVQRPGGLAGVQLHQPGVPRRGAVRAVEEGDGGAGRLAAARPQRRGRQGPHAGAAGRLAVGRERRGGLHVLDGENPAGGIRQRQGGRLRGLPLPQANGGHGARRPGLAVGHHEHGPGRPEQLGDRGQHLPPHLGRLQRLGQPRAEPVQQRHVGQLGGQLVAEPGQLRLLAAAGDGGGQHVGHRVEEVDVGGGERPPLPGVGAEQAVGPAAAPHRHADAADHAVGVQEVGRREAPLGGQVGDQHRLVGEQGRLGRPGRGPQHPAARGRRPPADPLAQAERLAVVAQFHHAAVVDGQGGGHLGGGPAQQRGGVLAGQGPPAQLGHHLLLAGPRVRLGLGFQPLLRQPLHPLGHPLVVGRLLAQPLHLPPPPLLLQPPLGLAPLRLPQPLRLPPDLPGLLVQLDEHRHLGAQHLGHYRLGEEVDGPHRVAVGHQPVGAVVGGQEDDGDVAGAVALADQRGGLQPVHPRHPHV
jgi:hypothetical protein